MSDNIPFEIQVEIIKKLPSVKSLLRFRSVSKQWRSFIDTSNFISGYPVRDTNTLLLRYKDTSNKDKYVCFLDDDNNNDTLTQQQVWFLSWFVTDVNDLEVIGSSHGLLCLHSRNNIGMFLLSNPSIRKSVCLKLPKYPFLNGFLGFAVCPVTNDPTIVMITSSWQVGVFKLSSKRFTYFQYTRLPPKIVGVMSSQVVIDRCIYWAAKEAIITKEGIIAMGGGTCHFRYMIVSFDLVAKEIRLVDIPRRCTLNNPLPERHFFISELRGSLVLFVPNEAVEVPVCGVWKMELDESFTKMFTITTPDYTINNILGFRKNGDQLVMETQKKEDDQQFAAVQLYDPCSEHVNNLGIVGKKRSFFMASVKETLLLMDELDYVNCS